MTNFVLITEPPEKKKNYKKLYTNTMYFCVINTKISLNTLYGPYTFLVTFIVLHSQNVNMISYYYV